MKKKIGRAKDLDFIFPSNLNDFAFVYSHCSPNECILLDALIHSCVWLSERVASDRGESKATIGKVMVKVMPAEDDRFHRVTVGSIVDVGMLRFGKDTYCINMVVVRNSL